VFRSPISARVALVAGASLRTDAMRPSASTLDALTYAIIATLPFVVFWWLVPGLGALTLGNDYVAFPISHQMELMYCLKHGSFPLFVPGFAGGRAAAALTLGQLYHPLPHLATLIPGYWNGRALDWCTLVRLASLALCQLAAFHLLRRLDLGRAAAFAVSFLAVYNLRTLDMFRYGAALENTTGLLLLCSAMALYYLSPTRVLGPGCVIGATYLLATGGHPQILHLGSLAAATVGLALPFAVKAIKPGEVLDARRVLRFYGAMAACGAAGLLLAAAYLLPLYTDFVADAALRVGRDYQWSLSWTDSVGGALASFFEPLHADVHGAFGSSALLLLAALVPLLMVFGVRVPRAVLGLWGFGLIVFLIGLGAATPLHHAFWAHVPLADAFRAPGRVVVALPFVFLLVLAWLLGPGADTALFPGRRLPLSPLFLAGLLALAVLGAYHLGWFPELPPPSRYIPSRIHPYPGWVDPLVRWTGLAALVLVTLAGLRTRARPVLLAGLALAAVAQTGVELRYGTWTLPRRTTPTLARMDEDKRAELSFRGPAGYGMESPAVLTQMERSILEPRLARFYRTVDFVATQDEAYAALAARRSPVGAVVEDPRRMPGHRAGTAGSADDRVALARSSFNEVVLRVAAGSDGYLALAFPFSDHWSALVDAAPEEVLRANGYELAVPVRAGEHEVAFRFSSAGATAGMAASCAALSLLGLYFSCVSLRGSRRVTAIAAAVLLPATLFLAWRASLYASDNLGTRYTWSSRDFPPADDLAYGRTARMSSIRPNPLPYSHYYAGVAVDGDQERYSSATSQEDNPWWEVDLGEVREIGSTVVYGASGPQRLVLRLSSDGAHFTDLPLPDEPPGGGPRRVELGTVAVRYVRLQGAGPGALSLREVEVYPAVRAAPAQIR
jgi:hypothetical protein